MQAGRSDIARIRCGDLTELDRVNAHLVRCVLHVQVMRKMHLAGRVAAHRARGRVVGVDTAGKEVHAVQLVREVRPEGRLRAGRDAGSAVRAAIQYMIALLGQHLTSSRVRIIRTGRWVSSAIFAAHRPKE